MVVIRSGFLQALRYVFGSFLALMFAKNARCCFVKLGNDSGIFVSVFMRVTLEIKSAIQEFGFVCLFVFLVFWVAGISNCGVGIVDVFVVKF